ncbi:hypothetical protein BD311DRAFT_759728 [Dichomitus squalens]|nr:hypothetical protein BD311DRAFT_759728 [Dichomitus squalens]
MPAMKVYSNSVLAMLNCRQALSEHTSSGSHYTPAIGMSTIKRKDRSGGASATQDSTSLPSSYAIVRIETAKSAAQENIVLDERKDVNMSPSMNLRDDSEVFERSRKDDLQAVGYIV